jgi:molybdopterin-guanine dinucleotide biosynthesis protein A
VTTIAPRASGAATPGAFVAVVLAGGMSRRMGVDKAFVDVGGAPLVSRVAAAVRAAGAADVVAVGGDGPRLVTAGLRFVPDRWPGEGPLGGLVTALAAVAADRTDPTSDDLVFVTACDHPALDPALPGALRAALDGAPGALAAIPVVGGRRQVLAALYRTAAGPLLEQRFIAGARSVQTALDGVPVVEAPDLPSAWFVDLDTPAAVDYYAATHDRAHPAPGERD